MKFGHLSWKSKTAIRKGLWNLLRNKKESPQSFLDWLQNQNQPQEAIDHFWDLVLVSALSETLDRIDLFHARKVFFDGFVRHRDSWKVQIPTIPVVSTLWHPFEKLDGRTRGNNQPQKGLVNN